jgi:hypothetical protein
MMHLFMMVFALLQSQSQEDLQQGMAAAVLAQEQKLDMLQHQLHTMHADNRQGHEQIIGMVSNMVTASDIGAVAGTGSVPC